MRVCWRLRTADVWQGVKEEGREEGREGGREGGSRYGLRALARISGRCALDSKGPKKGGGLKRERKENESERKARRDSAIETFGRRVFLFL